MAGVMFTPSTYGSGEQTLEDLGYQDPSWYPNLAPDPGVELGTYAPSMDSANALLLTDQYRLLSSTLGAGGTISMTFDSTAPRSGTRCLRMATSTAGSPNSFNAYTPNFDVEEGTTYVATCWVTKTLSTATKVYVRIAGGSDDNMDEYPATNIANAIPSVTSFENINITTANTWQQVVLIFTVPAGITRCTFILFNWQAPSATTLYFDDFRVAKLDNSPYCDTGWLTMPLLNGWADYNAPGAGLYPPVGFRKIAGTVHIRGLLKSGTVASVTEMAGPLPPGFRPQFSHMNSVVCSPGTPGARVDVYATGYVMLMYGGHATWTSITVAPFPADG